MNLFRPVHATDVATIPTPVGDARVHVHEPRGVGRTRARSTVVLGHGAGGGVEDADLSALAAVLPGRGHRVVLVEQPWRVAGKRVAPAASTLDKAWRAVVAGLRAQGHLEGGPLVVGGRSTGARVACRTAEATGTTAVVALAFPLHPPGRPERSRAAEGCDAGVPVLVVQGERDAFGTPEEVAAQMPDATVVRVPGADHGFVPARSAPCTRVEALELVAEAVAREVGGWCGAEWAGTALR